MERTLIIVKPDAVQRGLTGEVIKRFEQRGLKIVAMKFIHITEELAKKHCAVHEGKPFFEGLVSYITSSPVVVMALEGNDAIAAARKTIGATKPVEAEAGSIRGDFGMEIGRNLVHGSDSPENGLLEISNFFTAEEIYSWDHATDAWIQE